MKNIAIKTIAVTLFEITVPDIAADPGRPLGGQEILVTRDAT